MQYYAPRKVLALCFKDLRELGKAKLLQISLPKNAHKRGCRKRQKKEEPAADIDRKQAHGGGGEIRTHVPIARQPDFESGSL